MAEREITHLFRQGSNISLCCKMHMLDQRVKVGTFDPKLADCEGAPGSGNPAFCPPLAPGDDETCTHTPSCPTKSEGQGA